MGSAPRAKHNIFLLHELTVFLVLKNLISSRLFVVRRKARAVRADRATDKQNMPSERGFYGWKLVFILWLLDFLNMGFPLYGGAVINTYMLKEIPMSRSAFGLGFTLLNLFVGIPSVLVGASIVRWGIRKTFGIGSTLILFVALWLSFVALSGGNQFRHYRSCSNSHHALVQPLSRKNYGGDALGVGICRIHCGADDQSHSNGEWWKLAPSMGDRGRDFRVIRDCRVSVCERAARRSWPVHGWRAERGAICEDVGCGRPGYEVSVGA